MTASQQSPTTNKSGSATPDLGTAADNLGKSKRDLDEWDKAAGEYLAGDTTATPPPTTR